MSQAPRSAAHIVTAPASDAERKYFPRPVTAVVTSERVAQIPATPDYDLVYQGGKLIPNLTFTNLYLGGQPAWKASDITSIDHALAAAMSDRRLNNVMMQYFSNHAITSTFRPSTVLSNAAPSTISQSDAEKLLATLFQNGQIQGYDLSVTVFNLMLPSGVVLTDSSSASGGEVSPASTGERETKVSSLQGLGGYHGAISVSSGQTLYYAIGCYSEQLANGSQNGVVAFADPWKNVVATFYHELNEARTDPDVNGTPGWISNPIADMGGSQVEVGDAPIFEAGNNLSLVFQDVPLADGSGTVPVQFMYSNAVHGPEGPIDSPHNLAPAVERAGTALTAIGGVLLVLTGGVWLLNHVGSSLFAASTSHTLQLAGSPLAGAIALIATILNALSVRAPLAPVAPGGGPRWSLGFSLLIVILAVGFLVFVTLPQK